jgi:sigma-B regulation protein RsbQ
MPTLRHADVELAYRVGGDGPVPAVFLHGFQNAGDTWSATVAAFEHELTSLVPDLVGCGQSGAPASSRRCTIEAYAEDLGALIDHIGLDRPALVGHSLGAGIALRFALDRPGGTRGLILVSPISTRGLDFLPADRFDGLAHPTPEDQAALARAAFHRPPTPAQIDEVMGMVRLASPHHIEGAAVAMRDFIVEAELGGLRVPTLVIAGDRDRHVPLKNHLATTLAIPRCGLQVFHQVGHVPFVEVADDFNAVVRTFVSSL